jgi:hypothetical protein
LTIHDNNDWVILVFSVPRQECLQVRLGDPQDTVEPVRYQLPRIDPAPNRPCRDTQRFRDVGDGEKSHAVCAVAPTMVAIFGGDESAKMISRLLDRRVASAAVRFLMHGGSLCARVLEHLLEQAQWDTQQAAKSDRRDLASCCGGVGSVSGQVGQPLARFRDANRELGIFWHCYSFLRTLLCA